MSKDTLLVYVSVLWGPGLLIKDTRLSYNTICFVGPISVLARTLACHKRASAFGGPGLFEQGHTLVTRISFVGSWTV